MSRPLRIEYPDAWYHVMNQGRRGEDIFSADGDYDLFVQLLRESAQSWNVRVAAFCLMTHSLPSFDPNPRGQPIWVGIVLRAVR